MSNPFVNHVKGTASIALSGMVDYWVEPTPDDDEDNVLDKDGVASIGISIKVAEDGDVVYHDRHENVRTDYLIAGQPLPTSVKRILATGTAATGVKVAIAP